MSTPEAPKAATAEELLAVAAPPQTAQELEFKFPDGTVVKGKTQDELLAAAAKRYNDVAEHAKQVKEENAALRQAAQVQPQTTTPAAPVKGFDQQAYWNLMNTDPAQAQAYALSSWLGFDSPAEMKSVLEGTVDVARDVVKRGNAAAFIAQAPDFPNTQENADILADRVVAMGVTNPTVDALLAAHALCLKEGKYKAAEGSTAPPVPAAQMPTPPPPPPAGAAAISGVAPNLEEMANSMTPAQLKAAILKLQSQGAQ